MTFNHTLSNTYSFEAYMQVMEELMANKSTSGPNQSTHLIDFTTLNLSRMRRLNKTLKLDEALKAKLQTNNDFQRWVVISEAWCGDAAQNLPILNKIAEASDNIQLDIILRDENLEVMDDFLTNGSRSIPKLIAIDKNNEVLYTWGPRPQYAQDMLLAHKSNPNGESAEDFKLRLHKWYTKDKSHEVQEEFLALL
jgi:hypothetical protein